MPQVKEGVVVSNKMKKTVVVKVNMKVKHPLYKKIIVKSKKFKARDEIGVALGQKVKIAETTTPSLTCGINNLLLRFFAFIPVGHACQNLQP